MRSWILLWPQCDFHLPKGCPEVSQVCFWKADSEMECGMWDVYCGEFLGPMLWRGREGEGKPQYSTGQRMRTTLNSMGCSPARMIFRLCCDGGDSQVLCSLSLNLHQLLDINYSRKMCGIGYSAVCSWNNPPRGPSLKNDLCPPLRLTRKVKNEHQDALELVCFKPYSRVEEKMVLISLLGRKTLTRHGSVFQRSHSL